MSLKFVSNEKGNSNVKPMPKMKEKEFKRKVERMMQILIEWHEKYTMNCYCVVVSFLADCNTVKESFTKFTLSATPNEETLYRLFARTCSSAFSSNCYYSFGSRLATHLLAT